MQGLVHCHRNGLQRVQHTSGFNKNVLILVTVKTHRARLVLGSKNHPKHPQHSCPTDGVWMRFIELCERLDWQDPNEKSDAFKLNNISSPTSRDSCRTDSAGRVSLFPGGVKGRGCVVNLRGAIRSRDLSVLGQRAVAESHVHYNKY